MAQPACKAGRFFSFINCHSFSEGKFFKAKKLRIMNFEFSFYKNKPLRGNTKQDSLEGLNMNSPR